MNRGERWLIHFSNLLVGGTGLVYAMMKYLMEPASPFSVINHPLQPLVLTLHLVAALLLVLAVGILWKSHISERLHYGQPPGRATGISLTLTFLPMVLSGYLLQTASAAFWRQTWLVVHLTTSAIWLLMFLAHQVVFIVRRLRLRRSRTFAGARGLEAVQRMDKGNDNPQRQKPAA
jgi:hypothetical protein